jgi:hypothetical protein
LPFFLNRCLKVFDYIHIFIPPFDLLVCNSGAYCLCHQSSSVSLLVLFQTVLLNLFAFSPPPSLLPAVAAHSFPHPPSPPPRPAPSPPPLPFPYS